MTTNVSRSLNFYPKKGIIMEKSDADLLILDDNLDIITVIAKGELMMEGGRLLKKGTYE